MSTTTLPVIRLQSCPKGYTRDLDKTISPQETYERVQARMQAAGLDILAEVRRVDVGRLGIPVYLSVCGRDARGIMPTRKQMGKGSSPEQPGGIASAGPFRTGGAACLLPYRPGTPDHPHHRSS